MSELYYDKIYGFSEEKLIEEMTKLSNMLMSANPASPMYNQLLDMMNCVQDIHNEKVMMSVISKDPKKTESTAIDIGTVESHTHYPEYNQEDLLTALVEFYYKDKK